MTIKFEELAGLCEPATASLNVAVCGADGSLWSWRNAKVR